MSYSTVTALALSGLEHQFGLYGVDVVEIGSSCGLAASLWDRLDHLDQHIPLTQFVRFMEELDESVPDRALMWNVGRRYDVRALGDVGRLVMMSPTLGEAICHWRDHFCLVQNDAYMTVDIGEQTTTVRYKILDMNIWPRRADAEFTLGIFHSIVEYFTGERMNPDMLVMESYAGSGARLSSALRLHCQGGGGSNEIRFPTQWLSVRRPGPESRQADSIPLIRQRLYKRQCQMRRLQPISHQVRCALWRNLGEQPIDQTTIAGQLGGVPAHIAKKTC